MTGSEASRNNGLGRPPVKVAAGLMAVVAATVVVKFVAMAKELSIAGIFGVSEAVDALLVALVLPSFVLNLSGGSIDAAFTPVYIETREEKGRLAANSLITSATTMVLVLALVATLLLWLTARPILGLLGSGFGAEKLVLTARLFELLLPAVLLGSLAGLWTAAANAEERFGRAALAPIGVPLVTLVAVLMLGPAIGITAAAWGVAAGYAVQCALLVVTLQACDLPLRPGWGGYTPELRRTVMQFIPKATGAVLTVGVVLIDVSMAASLEEGSVSNLSYGIRVVAVVTALGATALSAVALPLFSRLVVARDWVEVSRVARSLSFRSALVALPIAVLVVVFSQTIIGSLFERGAFTPSDTLQVATVQSFYAIQLPFYFAAIVFVRLISSLQENRLLAFGAAINLTVNVVLNLVFMRWLGVAGIALSTSVAYAVSFAYLYFATRMTVRDRWRYSRH